jgi:hypothetical protein
MKIYILIASLLFVSCTSNGKNNGNDNANNDSIVVQRETKLEDNCLYEIESSLKNYYSDFLLFKAIDNIRPDLSNLESNEGYIWDYEQGLKTMIKQKPYIVDSLLYELKKGKDYEVIVRKISIWCDTYVMVSTMVFNITDWYIDPDEALYEIKDTKKIIRSFLQTKEQDWGSLSESQMSEIPYKICNYACELDDESRIKFYSMFFSTIKKLTKEHTKND